MRDFVFAGLLGTSVVLSGCATELHTADSTAENNLRTYCDMHHERCVIAGIIITGLVIALASSAAGGGGGTVAVGGDGGGGPTGGGGGGPIGGGGGSAGGGGGGQAGGGGGQVCFNGVCTPGGGGGNAGNASDERLKTEIVRVGQTRHNLPVYTFRYLGSTERFSGVLAQDVLDRPDLAHAVHKGSDGYYRVDYGVLGLELVNRDRMVTASRKAIDMARS
ncbi:MAG: tail fiber domain-containing protein [Roseitalea sp.]|jgi:hypothetical protein|nr:tail fiber domain-containing protein [Roseitalea sp.]MBO6722219.1 tail fiber domain-containing protein [Roseitalea sp.]MBO6744990.1 tail fiber domain-containing protein [Roseitalea sp.]